MQDSFAWTRIATIPRMQGAERALVGGLLLLTLVSRLYLSGAGTLQSDMAYWIRWSDQLNGGSFRSFYHSTSADYLPIYPYILWLLARLYVPLHHGMAGVGIVLSRDTLYKLPAILADVATVHLIYAAGRRWATPLTAGVAATVYATNPAIIADSARWGQVDSIPAYLMVLALVLFVEDRVIFAGVALALSVMTKPTALILVPLLAVVMLRRGRFGSLATLASSFGITALAVVWPFVPTGINIPHFVAQQLEVTTSRWPYATMNAFNFWALWQHNVRMLPDSQTWLGLALHTWGWLLLACLAVIVCVLAAAYLPRESDDHALVLLPAASLLIFGFFILLTRIHERHLLPTLPLLALTCAVWPRFWLIYIWLSLAYLLNLHFYYRQLFDMHEPLLGRSEVPILSALNVGALVGMLLLMTWTLARSIPAMRERGGR